MLRTGYRAVRNKNALADNLRHANNHIHLYFSISFLNFHGKLSKIFLLLNHTMSQILIWKLDPFRVDKSHLQGRQQQVLGKESPKRILELGK